MYEDEWKVMNVQIIILVFYECPHAASIQTAFARFLRLPALAKNCPLILS